MHVNRHETTLWQFDNFKFKYRRNQLIALCYLSDNFEIKQFYAFKQFAIGKGNYVTEVECAIHDF